MTVTIEREVYPKTSKLVALYDSVCWQAYTRDEASLTRAVANSLAVVTAWESEERLIGLARAVGDGESILFIQDLLVHPEYQGQGVGKALLKAIMAMYPQVPKKLILADSREALNAFYCSSGFVPVTDKDMTAWIYEDKGDAPVKIG